jgi:hypothetical protein
MYHDKNDQSVFMSISKNIFSHSQWPSILMNRPHFGQTVKGSCGEDDSFSPISLK